MNNKFKMRDDNVFPDKITKKSIRKHYKHLIKLLKKDPNAVFFSISRPEPLHRRMKKKLKKFYGKENFTKFE